jgi:O-antigen ligase
VKQNLSLLAKAGFERIEVYGTAPMPPLPAWLEQISQPLYRSLASGQAKQWRFALYAWRAVRLFGWGWQKVAHPQDDIYATLEAVAFRPV